MHTATTRDLPKMKITLQAGGGTNWTSPPVILISGGFSTIIETLRPLFSRTGSGCSTGVLPPQPILAGISHSMHAADFCTVVAMAM